MQPDAVAAGRPALLPLLLAYALTVPADSGALTSGMSMAAHPDYRGATTRTTDSR